MDCKYYHDDCETDRDNCILCVNSSKYKKAKVRKYGIQRNNNKKSNRMGSQAEVINHKTIKDTVEANMTPNSGAGKIKGDEQIRGLVNIMQEVKTQEVVRAKGHSQFTIKREWLDKLAEEAPAENMDFWYLVFSFKNTDEQQYVIIDKQQLNDMVATMVEDRKVAKEAQDRIDLADKKRMYAEANNLKLQAEIDMLKAEIKILKGDNEDE